MKSLLTAIAIFMACATHAQEYLKQGDACYTQKSYACAYDNYMKGYEAGLNAVKDVLYYRIGYCLSSMKRYEEAKRWYWRAITEKNTLSPVWELASAHLSLKKYDSSAFYYVKAFALATTTEQKRNISYWAGASYFNLKDYSRAKTQLLECIKQDTAYGPSHLLLGRTYLLLKDYTTAEKTLYKALQYTKDSASISDTHLKIGEVYYTQRKYAEAVPHYRNAARYDPKETTPITYTGDAYSNMDNLDSATFYYQKAINMELAYEEDMDSVLVSNIYVALMAGRVKTKDTLRALQYLPQAMKYNILNDRVDTYLDMVYARKDVKMLESLIPPYAIALKEIGEVAEAAQLYTRLASVYKDMKLSPKVYSTLKSAMLIAPTNKAVISSFINLLIADKKFKEANDTLTRLLPQVAIADIPEIKGLKGELLYLQKDTAGAAVILRDVVKSTYSNYNANFYLGLMALQRKDSNTCRTYWSRISGTAFDKTKPAEKTLPVHRLLAMDNFIKGSDGRNSNYANSYFSTASSHFEYILGIDSSLPVNRMYAGVANLQARKIYTGKAHLEKAIALYQKKKDTLAMIYRWLGLAEMRGETMPNYTKAFDFYQKGIQANPADSAVVNDLASAYYEQKDYAKSAEFFGKLTGLYKAKGNISVAYYNKALCHYMNKQKAEAAADVAKSLAINPEYADAKKLKAELEKPTQ